MWRQARAQRGDDKRSDIKRNTEERGTRLEAPRGGKGHHVNLGEPCAADARGGEGGRGCIRCCFAEKIHQTGDSCGKPAWQSA